MTGCSDFLDCYIYIVSYIVTLLVPSPESFYYPNILPDSLSLQGIVKQVP